MPESGPIKTAIRKVGLRLVLKGKARGADAATAAAIDKCLANRGAFDAVFDALQAEHEAQVGGPLQDFLQFLLDNIDEIIALILKLIPLFV